MLSLECKNCHSYAELPKELLETRLLGDILLEEDEVICFACRKSFWNVSPKEDSYLFVQSIQELRNIEINASCLCQSIWRMIVIRRKFKKWLEDKKYRLFLSRCATKLQTYYRRHLAIRKVTTIRKINRIDNTSDIILIKAIESKYVFWYKGVQLSFLLKDYIELIRVTGYIPTRYQVERNIYLIWEIVVKFEDLYSTIIQKNVRRMIQNEYVLRKRQRLKEQRANEIASVTLITSLYRMHVQLCKYRQTKQSLNIQRHLERYRSDINRRRKQIRIKEYKKQIKQKYIQSIEEKGSDRYLPLLLKSSQSRNKVSTSLPVLINQYIKENYEDNK